VLVAPLCDSVKARRAVVDAKYTFLTCRRACSNDAGVLTRVGDPASGWAGDDDGTGGTHRAGVGSPIAVCMVGDLTGMIISTKMTVPDRI